MVRSSLVRVAAFLLLFSGSAMAQVPPLIHQEGLLIDRDGAAIAGPVDLGFRLYDRAEGGASAWNENHPGIALVEGYYSVLLGSRAALDGAVLMRAQYLAVVIGGNELLPRTRLASVPFALIARSVEGGTVSATQVAIGGNVVIDPQGRWVGDPTGLRGAVGPAGPVGPQGPAGAAGGNGSPDTPAQVRDKLVQVDGAGSGVDADLLDGVSSAAFMRADADTGTTGSVRVAGSLTVNGPGAFGGVRANDVAGHNYITLLRPDRAVEAGIRYMTGANPDWWVFTDNDAADNDLRFRSPGGNFSDRSPQLRVTSGGDLHVGNDLAVARNARVNGTASAGDVVVTGQGNASAALERSGRDRTAGLNLRTAANVDWSVFTDNDAADNDLRLLSPGGAFGDRNPQGRLTAAGDLFVGRHVQAGATLFAQTLMLAGDARDTPIARFRATQPPGAGKAVATVESADGTSLVRFEADGGRALPGVVGNDAGLDVIGSTAANGQLRLSANRAANAGAIVIRPNRINLLAMTGGAEAATALTVVGPTGRVGIGTEDPQAQLDVLALRNEVNLRQSRANAGSYDLNVANNNWSLALTGQPALILAEGPAERVHIKSLVLPPLDRAPANPVPGQIYNDRATSKVLIWNGAAWVQLGGGGGGGGNDPPQGQAPRAIPGFDGTLGPDLSNEGLTQCYGWTNDGRTRAPNMDVIRASCGNGERVSFAGRRCDGSPVRHDMVLRSRLSDYLLRQERYWRDFDIEGRFSFNSHPSWLVLNLYNRNWQDPGRLWEPYVGDDPAAVNAHDGHVLSQTGNNAHDQHLCVGDQYYLYIELPVARPPEPVPNGIVGHWPLDGNARDVSGRGLHGVAENGVVWAAGKTNQAAQIDANDDAIRVVDNGPTALDVRTLTMAAWVFPFSCRTPGDRGIIMNKESVYEFGLENGTCALQAAFSPCWRWWGSAVAPANRWSHVAIVFDGNQEIHYVDGVRREATACAGLIDINDQDFKIGSRNGDGGNSSDFNGLIDEAYLYSRPLNDAEVRALFAGGDQGLGGAANPARSCFAIKQAAAASPSGLYWLDPDGAGGRDPFRARCEMDLRGGGWTLMTNHEAAAGYFGNLAGGMETAIGDPDARLYSILGMIDHFRRDNRYEMLYWNRQFDRQLHTVQTTSPLDNGRRGGCPEGNQIIGSNYQPDLFCGYTPGPVDWTVINGHGPNWTHAVGQFKVYANWPMVCTHNSGYQCNHYQFYVR